MTDLPGPNFTWGDSAVVVAEAPANFRPSAKVSIIGVFDEAAISRLRYRKFDDSVVYAVEYEDGSALDVEQKWLSPSF